MTTTFDSFIRQYKAKGREKAEGYDRSHFDGLSVNEKGQVFSMLANEMYADPDSAQWLFYLDPPKAEKACLDFLSKHRYLNESGVFVIYYHLFKYSGDMKYQQLIIDSYPNYPDYHKARAVDCACKTPSSPSLMSFLKRVLLTETIELAVAAAAYCFLAKHKVQKDRFPSYLTSLKSSLSSTRQAAIDAIEQNYPV